MNSRQFARLLRVLADGAEYAGDKTGAVQLENLAAVFDAEPERNISRVLVRRLRSSFAMRDSQMGIARALQHLRIFRQASSDVGRKSDLESLDSAIDGLDKGDKPPAPRADSAAARKPKAVQSPLADEYLLRLEKAGDDRELGETVLRDLEANKALDVAQLNWIVQQYAGGASAFATRPMAIKRIGERLETIVRRGEKSREIRRLTDSE
jgi:hypothetical protein